MSTCNKLPSFNLNGAREIYWLHITTYFFPTSEFLSFLCLPKQLLLELIAGHLVGTPAVSSVHLSTPPKLSWVQTRKRSSLHSSKVHPTLLLFSLLHWRGPRLSCTGRRAGPAISFRAGSADQRRLDLVPAQKKIDAGQRPIFGREVLLLLPRRRRRHARQFKKDARTLAVLTLWRGVFRSFVPSFFTWLA